MNFEKRKIIITVNNLDYSFYYSCNQNTTFLDLLEYFAFLVPSLKICQCYHFQASKDKKNFDENCLIISSNSKIAEYSDYLSDLILVKAKNNCIHYNLYYLLYSKHNIVSYFQECIKKLNDKKNKEIAELKKKIKELTENKVMLNQPTNVNDFYDVIVHIDSIKDINKGWKIDMNEKSLDVYNKYKKESIIKIGIIGNANKGKSFILSKISKMNLPSGMSIKTEGLSIKYPDLKEYKNRKIVLLDSAGLETPVLVSEGIVEEEKKNELFKEKCREKLITELFLQNYIVHNSDILIVVVDCLSFSEQKLLMKVKKEIERAKKTMNLYIIHNLKTFTKKAQVEDYIKNTLLKSATFTLEEGIIVDTQKTQSKEGVKFFEKKKDGKISDIFHLIYANEDSEAGNYYNPFTLDFIENIYQSTTNYKPYDVIETIKDRYIQVSEDIIEKNEKNEKNEKITRESFDDSNPNIIKLKNDKEIILKQCLIDELGFSNLKPNGFEPKYNIYKKDNSIKIRVEIPGNCQIKSERATGDNYNIIKISGEKIKDLEPQKIEDNIYNIREFGKFFLEIPFPKEHNLSRDKPLIKEISGLYIIEYKIDEPEEGVIFTQDKKV